jgi:hypothetical protein
MLFRPQRQTWWNDLFAGFFFGSAGEIQVEEEGQRVGVFGHAVGRANDGVEVGLGVAQWIVARLLESAVKIAERVVQLPHRLAPQRTQGHRFFSNGFNPLTGRILRPWKSVEDSIARNENHASTSNTEL